MCKGGLYRSRLVSLLTLDPVCFGCEASSSSVSLSMLKVPLVVVTKVSGLRERHKKSFGEEFVCKILLDKLGPILQGHPATVSC